MYRLTIVSILSLLSFCAKVNGAEAGPIPHFGHTNSFWLSHRVVLGTIVQWDNQEGNDYVFAMKVQQCLPAGYSFGHILRGVHKSSTTSRFLKYPARNDYGGIGPRSGYGSGREPEYTDTLGNIKVGQKVIMLVEFRPVGPYPPGHASLPDGSSLAYMMFPDGLPLFVVDDEGRKDLDGILQACFLASSARDIRQQVDGVAELITSHPNNEHVKRFAKGYLKAIISEAESALRSAARVELSAL